MRVVLLLLFWGRLLAAANANSATFDEILHILQGVLYWQHGDLYSVVQNPPLSNALIGVPVSLLFQPQLPLDYPIWQSKDWLRISQFFMWELNGNGLQLLWAGRFAIICLALLLGSVLYRWGTSLGRTPLAGLIVLFLYSFDPNVLAHAHLATTDLGMALFLATAAYLLWRYWQKPGRLAYLSAGLGIGAVLAAKFTGLVTVPAVLLMSVYRVIGPRVVGAVREPPLRRVLAEMAGWLLLGGLVFLAIYRFDIATLAEDFRIQQAHQFDGHSSYLLGELSKAGWWYYYPIVFAIKTPLPVLALFGVAIWVMGMRRPFAWQAWWLLLVAGGVLAASLLSRVNLGYRYLLPALPLLYLLVGQLVAPGMLPVRGGRWAYGLALAMVAAVSLAIHPHYLAYFNLLAGGPDNGWRFVLDSNLDWGQDLQALRPYMAERGIESVQISWLGSAPLTVYGINGTPIPGWPVAREEPLSDSFYPPHPAPGVYVLSATQLQGVYLDDPQRFAWFQQRPPDDKIGYSLFVYEVAAEGPLTGLALSGIGIGALAPADFEQAFQGNNVWPRWYDARTSLLWPGGGAAQGWAAVGDGHQPTHPALQRFYPEPMQRGVSDEGLHYSLYRWNDSPITSRLTQTAASPCPPAPLSPCPLYTDFGWSPEPGVGSSNWEAARRPLAAQAVFGDSLQLLTYEMVEQSTTSQTLLSYWRVVGDPAALQNLDLSLFVHLLDGDGRVVAQHDGLDVRPAGLRPGDEFAQLHTIQLPADLPPGDYALQLGLYDRQTMARLPITTVEERPDRLLLHRFAIGPPP